MFRILAILVLSASLCSSVLAQHNLLIYGLSKSYSYSAITDHFSFSSFGDGNKQIKTKSAFTIGIDYIYEKQIKDTRFDLVLEAGIAYNSSQLDYTSTKTTYYYNNSAKEDSTSGTVFYKDMAFQFGPALRFTISDNKKWDVEAALLINARLKFFSPESGELYTESSTVSGSPPTVTTVKYNYTALNEIPRIKSLLQMRFGIAYAYSENWRMAFLIYPKTTNVRKYDYSEFSYGLGLQYTFSKKVKSN